MPAIAPISQPISHTSDATVAPLLVLLAIQLAALAMGAARIPLAARWPATDAPLALDEMFVVQVIAASMLFPVLATSFRATALIVASSLPFAFLAGALSGAQIAHIAFGSGVTTAWIIGLALLGVHGRVPGVRAAIMIVAISMSLGLPLLSYLNREFGVDESAGLWWLIPLSPTAAALSAAHGAHGGAMWVSPGFALLVGGALSVISWRGDRSRDKLSTRP